MILKKENFNFQIPVNPNFSSKTTVYKDFRLWKESGTLEKVLVRLVKETQDPSQSHYQKLLENLQKIPFLQSIRRSTPKLRPLSDEKRAFVDPSLSKELPCPDLDLEKLFDSNDRGFSHLPFFGEIDPLNLSNPSLSPAESNPNQTLSLNETVTRRTHESKPRTMSDEEWAVIEPLFRKTVASGAASSRRALNSILLMLITGVSCNRLPVNPNFCKAVSAYQYFRLWRDRGTFENVLFLLKEGTQGSSQLYYQDLLARFQNASTKRLKPVSIQTLKPTLGQVRSGFQGVNDKEWALVGPLLTKRIESKESPRPALNSIFLMLIDGVPGSKIPLTPDFSRRPTAYRFFRLWRKNGIFEKILTRLVETAQGALQSNYRKLLENLKKDSNLEITQASISSFKLEPDAPLSC